MANIVYEDDKIKVTETGKDYDFIATIENKTSQTVYIVPENLEEFYILPVDWVGLLADEEGRTTLEAIRKNRFIISFESEE